MPDPRQDDELADRPPSPQPSTRTPMSAPALESLLTLAGTGDREAFAGVYDATASQAFGVALRVARDRAHAEDVTQEAYLDIWLKGAKFDPLRGSALGWILTVVHRRAIDRVRSTQSRSTREGVYTRHDQASVALLPHDPTGDLAVATSEGERVRLALTLITKIQRESIELAYFGGHTCGEVAQLTGVPLGTAKSRIRDGLIGLRDLLGAPDNGAAALKPTP